MWLLSQTWGGVSILSLSITRFQDRIIIWLWRQRTALDSTDVHIDQHACQIFLDEGLLGRQINPPKRFGQLCHKVSRSNGVEINIGDELFHQTPESIIAGDDTSTSTGTGVRCLLRVNSAIGTIICLSVSGNSRLIRGIGTLMDPR